MLPLIPIPRAGGNPVAGQDYPRSWEEFLAFFPDEAACARFLERLSWPDGFVCPACGWAGDAWRGSRRRLGCRSCGRGTTVTAGTLFQGTRTPLRQWLAAAWHVSTAEQGISARRLQRALGLASYETAWTMLHRLRRAMVRSGRPRLEGVAEAGRMALPARATRGVGGRSAERVSGGRGAGEVPRVVAERPIRAVVAVAVEDRGQEPGRVRMQPLPSSDDGAFVGFLSWAVEPGTVIRADGLRNPAALARIGCAPDPAAAPGSAPRLDHLRMVERRLSEWLLGTHQGATSSELLEWYLDEFTFRFNRRSARHRGLLFYRLLEEALVTPPQPYGAVVAP